eukprot:10799706-Heterocapsa_arctica.AAC.1
MRTRPASSVRSGFSPLPPRFFTRDGGAGTGGPAGVTAASDPPTASTRSHSACSPSVRGSCCPPGPPA